SDAVAGASGRAAAGALRAPEGDRVTERWLRRLQTVDRVRLRDDAAVALWAEDDEGRWPVLAAWREGAARVVLWAGDLRAATTDDDATARWWAALLAARDGIGG
ncbi:MAG: hypothetical protein JWM10_2648, partial [Myxococcaceae bacterium]|nr:hypothetical protein [Myxococcaceae bacterium]